MDKTKMKLLAARKWLENKKNWIVIDACCSKFFDIVAIGNDEHIHYIYVSSNEYLPNINDALYDIELWRREHHNSFSTLPFKYEFMNVYLTGENKAKIKLINEQFHSNN